MFRSIRGLAAAVVFALSSPLPAAGSAPPFGAIDTPLAGAAGVTGSVAVTGWALDDSQVVAVRILRDPVGSEPANTKVFIGTAAFISGARPDVAAAYSTFPLKDRAGWGYLMLTNILPNQGNGTYTLYAYADDADGGTTLLGSRTITCTNASATKPFGGIDTPEQGATISGSAYVNFGWALTPSPKSIPTDGSTITVYIDGVPAGHPTYNQHRVDVAAMFPGLANSNGAVGYFMIDTTKLTNGVHTIHWGVTDSTGTSEGIGSRYFTVQNGAPSKLWLEDPSGTVSGTIAGKGWAFRCGGSIADYQLLIDGVPFRGISFSTGATRPDVETAYRGECPTVGNQAGFTFFLDTSMLRTGPHEVQVQLTDDLGQRVTSNTLALTVSSITSNPFFPESGPSGTEVIIRGQGFSPTSVVSFDGQPSEAVFVDSTTLVTFVPFVVTPTTVQPLSAGEIVLAVDSQPRGRFTVTPLPENPNPPGQVWSAVTNRLVTDLPPALAALSAELTRLDGIATEPRLRALLAATRNALPDLEEAIRQMSNSGPTLNPSTLSVFERSLLTVFDATSQPREINQAAGVVSDLCDTTPMMRTLCDRKTADMGLTAVDKYKSRVCSGLLVIGYGVATFINPAVLAGVEVIAAGCLVIDIVQIVSALLLVPEVTNVTLSGPSQLLSSQIGTFVPSVTIRHKTAVNEIASLVLTALEARWPALPKYKFADELAKLLVKETGVKYPDFTLLAPKSGEIAPQALSWKGSGLLSQAGDVNQFQAAVVQQKLKARVQASLIAGLRTDEDKNRLGSVCGNQVTGCLDVDVVPGTTTQIRLEGPSGTVTGAVGGSGWAFRCGGSIQQYRLFVDGVLTGTSFGVVSRPDVAASYRAECPTIDNLTGFSFSLNTSALISANQAALSSGSHQIQVQVVDDLGHVTSSNVTVINVEPPSGFLLTIAKAGTGAGTVTANPPGPTYAAGTIVTLTAAADAGSTFTGWSGDCAGTGVCQVTMTAAKSVTATFTPSASPASPDAAVGQWSGTIQIVRPCPAGAPSTYSWSAPFTRVGDGLQYQWRDTLYNLTVTRHSVLDPPLNLDRGMTFSFNPGSEGPAVFTGQFSADFRTLTGTLTGQFICDGKFVSAKGTWQGQRIGP